MGSHFITDHARSTEEGNGREPDGARDGVGQGNQMTEEVGDGGW